ncbi:MAG TPA: protease complex subunit PrcB family protein [Vicinamibacterales bacterium]|nr:protease complex subunit PrcB family protein [Vicinamibacterales bacterium]
MTALALIVSLAMQAVPDAPFQTVARGTMSQIDTPRQVVVRTAAEWMTLWRQHSPAEVPAVDFGSRTVVAVFLGSRMSAGFSVEFVRTQEAGGVLTVYWTERRPDRGEISAQVITSPMHAVAIPRFAGEIRFEKVEK